jgi:hypothetical protein
MENLKKYVTSHKCTYDYIIHSIVDFKKESAFPYGNLTVSPVSTECNLEIDYIIYERKRKIDELNKRKSKHSILEILIKEIDKLAEENSIRICEDVGELKGDIKTKINIASNLIATTGRYGPAEIILISKKNFEKLGLEEIKKDYEFYFTDFVKDIILYRKNNCNQPGLVMFYNKRKLSFEKIGFYPEKQYLKIKL